MPLLDPYAGVDWRLPGCAGNLHAHSTRSDGRAAPQAMLAAYAAAGHGFSMLSDHDTWTSPEMLAGLDAHGLRLIPGQEITRDGEHILQVGGTAPAAPVADRQRVIDAIRAAGGLAVMNHPNWFREQDHCRQERLMELQGYAGIEVANAVIDVHEGDRWACSCPHWDYVCRSAGIDCKHVAFLKASLAALSR